MPPKGKLSFTKKDRLRVCSMPTLWGKEWGGVKQLLGLLSNIDEKLSLIATALQDEVMLRREQIQIQ
jgi:hypothetical protein